MTRTKSEAPEQIPIPEIQTAFSRARCRRPSVKKKFEQSLSTHGQLTPLTAVMRAGKLELVDGFKRLNAAKVLGWTTISVKVTQLDDRGVWAIMLALNLGMSSMTELDEALVLRELLQTGLTQVEIAGLIDRHKSWVSRRVGLVERLHPELVEGMKLGLLHPGVARRLLPLPPGNQLEIAASAQNAGLGPRDTENLVNLWHRTRISEKRRALLLDPRAALRAHHPETQQPPVDIRLSARGQRLQRLIRILHSTAHRAETVLLPPPPPEDMELLAQELQRTSTQLSRLVNELGAYARNESCDDGTARPEIG